MKCKKCNAEMDTVSRATATTIHIEILECSQCGLRCEHDAWIGTVIWEAEVNQNTPDVWEWDIVPEEQRVKSL